MLYINRLFRTRRILLFLLFLIGSYSLSAQHDPQEGDFRAIADGAWYDFGLWEVFDGSFWTTAPEDSFPTQESSVFLAEFTELVLDSSAVCKNLHIHANAFLDLDTSTLNVWGHLRFFNGPIPGTNAVLPMAAPRGWIASEAEGELRFRGNSDRVIIVPGTGGTSDYLTGFNTEIAFNEGAAAVLEEDFRFDNLTVSSGVFTVNAAHLIAGSTSALSGNITLLDGVVFNPPSGGIFRSASSPLQSFVLDTLATLNLQADALIIAAQDLKLSGLVKVEETGSLPIGLPTNGGITGAAPVDTYYNLIIGGSTTKSLSGNTTINGLLTLTDAYLNSNGFGLAYGSDGGLEYAGTNPVLTGDFEFPAVDGPSNLVITNPNVSLHDHRLIDGQLTLNGGVLGLSGFDLTLGEDSPLIAGNFSTSNFIAIEGTGTLKKIFAAPGEFLFPIGERNGETQYTPAHIRINSGTFTPGSALSVSLVEGKHPDDVSPNSYLTRSWIFNSSIGDLNISGSLKYDNDDASGSEASISAYYYDANTAVPLELVDPLNRQLNFTNLDVMENDFALTGSNHCNIENNLITVIDQDYCGTVDLDNIVGELATISPSGPLSYQWEMQKDEGSWTSIPGANAKDFDPELITEAGFYEIRRSAKTVACTMEHHSNIYAFTLYPDITDFAIEDASEDEFCITGTGFTIQGETPLGGDESFSFQWERRINEEEFTLVGGDSLHYEEEEILGPGTYQYRRATISPTCGMIYSNIVTVNVYAEIDDFGINAPEIEFCDIPTEILIEGETPTGGGPSLVYSWQRQVNGGGFSPIGGNTEDLVDDDITVVGEYQYRRSVVGAPCGIQNSNVLSVFVRPGLSPNTISKEEDIVYCGNATGFELEGSIMSGGDENFTYNWYRIKDAGTAKDLSSNTVNYVENENLTPGVYRYYRKVISSACISTSDMIAVTIIPLIADNDITEPSQIEYCGIPSAIAIEGSVPTGGDGTYTYIWERSINDSDFEEVGTSQNLEDEDIIEPGKYEYRRMVASGSCSPVASNVVTIMVYPELSENKLSMASLDFCSEPTGFVIETLPMTGGDGTYTSVWERSFNGGEYIAVQTITAGPSASFEDSFEETEVLVPGNYTYRRIVTSAVCADTSNLLQVVVQQPLSNNTLEQPTGSEAMFCGATDVLNIYGSLPEGGSGTYEYRYEWSHNGGEWNVFPGSGKDLLNASLELPGNYDIRRVVYSTICYEMVSNVVSVFVTEPLEVTATITEKVGLEPNGSIELEVRGGLAPYSYFWTTTETTRDIYNLDAIEYRVVITDQSGCEVSEVYKVPQILGLKDSPNILSHKLYPNPVEDVLHVEVDMLKPLSYQIYVINNVGKVVESVRSEPARKIDFDVDMAAYPSGIYFVKIVTDNKTETWKFIKK